MKDRQVAWLSLVSVLSFGILSFGTANLLADGYRLEDSQREELIEKGLAYLASQQKEDGSWESKDRDGENHSTAITALAGLAFLGKGHVPHRGPYQEVLKKTARFLISAQRDQQNGLIAMPGENRPMYAHGFATLFLSQIYGMTEKKKEGKEKEEDEIISRENIKRVLKKAVSLIVETQTERGGWHYEPRSVESEASITVVQIQALRGCRNAGIAVPVETIRLALDCIKQSQYRSNDGQKNPPYPSGKSLSIEEKKELQHHPRQESDNDGGIAYQVWQGGPEGGSTSPALTAAGMAVLLSGGEYTLTEVHHRGLGYLDRRLFKLLEADLNQSYFLYGNFYAAQVYKYLGGEAAERYFSKIEPFLFKKAKCTETSCFWNIDYEGTVYATAMALLILEMPLNHLPIFED